MKIVLAGIGILSILLFSVLGEAAHLEDETVIAEKLCPKNLCLQHWNDVTLMMCDQPVLAPEPDRDYVFGTYPLGHTTCLCPCNFIKFYR